MLTILYFRMLKTGGITVERVDPSRLSVFPGHYNIYETLNVRGIKVTTIYTPTGFLNNLISNNIAILELSESLSWSDRIQPVCLPISSKETCFGDETEVTENDKLVDCYFTGWGGSGVKGASYILKELKTNIIPQDDCDAFYKTQVITGYYYNQEIISNKTLCAKGIKPSGPCFVSFFIFIHLLCCLNIYHLEVF